MAVGAEQGQVVDVGGTLGWGFPRQEVVGDALIGVGAALGAAFVSADESVDLGGRGEPVFSSLPEELAVLRKDLGDEGCVTGQLFDLSLIHI